MCLIAQAQKPAHLVCAQQTWAQLQAGNGPGKVLVWSNVSVTVACTVLVLFPKERSSPPDISCKSLSPLRVRSWFIFSCSSLLRRACHRAASKYVVCGKAVTRSAEVTHLHSLCVTQALHVCFVIRCPTLEFAA